MIFGFYRISVKRFVLEDLRNTKIPDIFTEISRDIFFRISVLTLALEKNIRKYLVTL